jgi:hypothetical protein
MSSGKKGVWASTTHAKGASSRWKGVLSKGRTKTKGAKSRWKGALAVAKLTSMRDRLRRGVAAVGTRPASSSEEYYTDEDAAPLAKAKNSATGDSKTNLDDDENDGDAYRMTEADRARERRRYARLGAPEKREWAALGFKGKKSASDDDRFVRRLYTFTFRVLHTRLKEYLKAHVGVFRGHMSGEARAPDDSIAMHASFLEFRRIVDGALEGFAEEEEIDSVQGVYKIVAGAVMLNPANRKYVEHVVVATDYEAFRRMMRKEARKQDQREREEADAKRAEMERVAMEKVLEREKETERQKKLEADGIWNDL